MPIIDIKSLILLIVAFLNLSLGVLVFFKNRKDKINIYYTLTALTTAGWSFEMGIFYATGDLDMAMVSWRFVYAAAALIGASFLSFSFVFPFALERPKSLHKILFYIFTAFIVVASIWPNALIEKVITC